MKKLVVWSLILTMLFSVAVFPSAVFATETTEGTTTEEETTTSTEVVHVNMDYEDNTTRTTFHSADDVTSGAGSWSGATSGEVGTIIDGLDGNAFSYTKASGYATYKPATKWTSGKILVSGDFSYNPNGTASRQTWVMTNAYTTDDGTSGSEYIWIAGLEAISGKGPSMYGISASSSSSSGKLFTATSTDEVYTVDILIDLDAKTRTWYTNGEQKATNKMSYTGMNSYTPGITQIKFNMTSNVYGVDNFQIIENPDAKFSFSQKGEVTTESDTITVRFSDTVLLTDTTDFIITDTTGETAATITEIEQVNGKFYNLKLSNKLEAGTYNLTLSDTTLTSVIAGTTSSNTTSEFTVTLERTYFDIDFENYTTSAAAATYYNTFNQYGSFALANTNDQTKSNTYGFAGDDSMGITCSSSGTRNMSYTLTEPITSGKVVVSYDAAFDATRLTGRQQLSYVQNETGTATDAATDGNILIYGINGNVTVIAGAKASGHYSGGSTKAYENNRAYRWDTVIDLDAKTITNYCDGVQFNKVTYISAHQVNGGIKHLYLRFKPSLTFFDNYKMTVNVDDFGYTASNIDELSDATILNFDDTMVNLDATKLVFTDPSGAAVTPTSITQITPRKYKVVLPDRIAGTYTVALADGVTSAIGNEPKIESTTFTVEQPLEDAFLATNLALAEAEGGASLTATLTNTSAETRQALLLIAVYDETGMVECHVEKVDVAAGETDAAKTTTYTTETDLTGKTVKGFVWNINEAFYAMYDAVTL